MGLTHACKKRRPELHRNLDLGTSRSQERETRLTMFLPQKVLCPGLMLVRVWSNAKHLFGRGQDHLAIGMDAEWKHEPSIASEGERLRAGGEEERDQRSHSG